MERLVSRDEFIRRVYEHQLKKVLVKWIIGGSVKQLRPEFVVTSFIPWPRRLCNTGLDPITLKYAVPDYRLAQITSSAYLIWEYATLHPMQMEVSFMLRTYYPGVLTQRDIHPILMEAVSTDVFAVRGTGYIIFDPTHDVIECNGDFHPLGPMVEYSEDWDKASDLIASHFEKEEEVETSGDDSEMEELGWDIKLVDELLGSGDLDSESKKKLKEVRRKLKKRAESREAPNAPTQ